MSMSYAPSRLRIPPGFEHVLEGLTREVLRDQPEDIIRYAAEYFRKKLEQRKDTGIDPTQPSLSVMSIRRDDSNPTQTTAAEPSSFQPSSITDEAIDIDLDDPKVAEAASKIQASFRGHLNRKKLETVGDDATAKPEGAKGEAEMVPPATETAAEEAKDDLTNNAIDEGTADVVEAKANDSLTMDAADESVASDNTAATEDAPQETSKDDTATLQQPEVTTGLEAASGSMTEPAEEKETTQDEEEEEKMAVTAAGEDPTPSTVKDDQQPEPPGEETEASVVDTSNVVAEDDGTKQDDEVVKEGEKEADTILAAEENADGETQDQEESVPAPDEKTNDHPNDEDVDLTSSVGDSTTERKEPLGEADASQTGDQLEADKEEKSDKIDDGSVQEGEAESKPPEDDKPPEDSDGDNKGTEKPQETSDTPPEDDGKQDDDGEAPQDSGGDNKESSTSEDKPADDQPVGEEGEKTAEGDEEQNEGRTEKTAEEEHTGGSLDEPSSGGGTSTEQQEPQDTA